MADYVMERRLWLPRPRPEVFDFFTRPEHVAVESPRRAGLRWLSSPPEQLAAGSTLDFSIRRAGLRVRWRLFIREFDPPYRFVDVQAWGPFARWEHVHRFLDATEEGSRGSGTWMVDRVTYRARGGTLGALAHQLALRRYITGRFDHRDRRIQAMWFDQGRAERGPLDA